MATPVALKLEEFKHFSAGLFAPGIWRIQYYDHTHLPPDGYITIGNAVIDDTSPMVFRFRPLSSASKTESSEEAQSENNLKAQFADVWKSLEIGQDKKQIEKISKATEKAPKYVLDQLSESVMRLGLIYPALEVDDKDFQGRKFAVIVMDTSSLRDGSIRHLREQYPHISLWVTIPQVSLMEIGERVANMTSQERAGMQVSNYTLIRSRPQVTIIPQEVVWIRANLPHETLELTPELFRTFRGYEPIRGQDPKEPDRFSINDRLILEGVKDMRRQRGLAEEVYLMTGDKDMARLARLEGIHTIFSVSPKVEEFTEGVYSLRYSHEAKTFIACSLQRFLWDLTHVFSQIRVECTEGEQAGRIVALFYYYPSKLVNDWIDGRLQVTDFGPGTVSNTP